MHGHHHKNSRHKDNEFIFDFHCKDENEKEGLYDIFTLSPNPAKKIIMTNPVLNDISFSSVVALAEVLLELV